MVRCHRFLQKCPLRPNQEILGGVLTGQMGACLLSRVHPNTPKPSTITQIQIHKYKYTNIQIQIHKYKYTNTQTTRQTCDMNFGSMLARPRVLLFRPSLLSPGGPEIAQLEIFIGKSNLEMLKKYQKQYTCFKDCSVPEIAQLEIFIGNSLKKIIGNIKHVLKIVGFLDLQCWKYLSQIFINV